MPTLIRKLIHLLPAFLALLILLAAGTSYWTGNRIEQHFHRTISEVNGKNAARLQVVEYRRGIFSSTAVTVFSLNSDGQKNGRPPLQLETEHRIWHGPFPPGGPSGWTIPAPAPLLATISSRTPVNDLQPAGPTFSADTTITLGGRAETFLRLTAPNPPLVLGELRGHLLYPADLRSMRGELTLRDLNLHCGQYQLGIDALSTVFHYRLEGAGANGETITTGQRLAMGNLRAGEVEYGPVAAELAWRNLDRQALTKLLGLMPWLTQVAREERPWEISPAAAQVLVEALPQLMRNSPALEIKGVTIGTPEGEATGRLTLAYQGRDQTRLFHPVMLLSGLDFEVEATFPAALLALIPNQRGADWEPDRSDGSADRANGDELSLQVSYRQGELTINDRPTSLQAILTLFR